MEFSRRCTLCGISYPDEFRFNKCPLHEEYTVRMQDAPHDGDWYRRLAFLTTQRQLAELDAELIPVADVRVRHDATQLWIHSWDLHASGVRHRLHDGDLIRVGAQVFEILGYVDASRLYLVRAFSMTVTDEDIGRVLSA